MSKADLIKMLDTMGKVELRAACKAAGVTGYGKMTNGGMRDALRSHYMQPTNTAAPNEVYPKVPVKVAPAPVAPPATKAAPRETTPLLAQHLGPVHGNHGGLKIEKDREEKNGIKKPSIGGMCRAVWDALDKIGSGATAKDVKALAETNKWNANNASIEFYQWRKFNGIRGRQKKV